MNSRWSLRSSGSVLSIGSRGSVLSIGSVGSVLSIGSVGSAGSVLSVGSFASACSLMSGLSTFANLLGPLLALPKASTTVTKKYAGCRTPDIDVDGDGLEAFCDSMPDDENKVVDICIDGDGTEFADVLGADGKVVMQCSEAQSGTKNRFVDGISVELNFETTAVKSIKPPL